MNVRNLCFAGVLWVVIFFIVVVLSGCQDGKSITKNIWQESDNLELGRKYGIFYVRYRVPVKLVVKEIMEQVVVPVPDVPDVPDIPVEVMKEVEKEIMEIVKEMPKTPTVREFVEEVIHIVQEVVEPEEIENYYVEDIIDVVTDIIEDTNYYPPPEIVIVEPEIVEPPIEVVLPVEDTPPPLVVVPKKDDTPPVVIEPKVVEPPKVIEPPVVVKPPVVVVKPPKVVEPEQIDILVPMYDPVVLPPPPPRVAPRVAPIPTPAAPEGHIVRIIYGGGFYSYSNDGNVITAWKIGESLPFTFKTGKGRIHRVDITDNQLVIWITPSTQPSVRHFYQDNPKTPIEDESNCVDPSTTSDINPELIRFYTEYKAVAGGFSYVGDIETVVVGTLEWFEVIGDYATSCRNFPFTGQHTIE